MLGRALQIGLSLHKYAGHSNQRCEHVDASGVQDGDLII